MSAIVGIWNFDGAPVGCSELGLMSGRLSHRGPGCEFISQVEPFGVIIHSRRELGTDAPWSPWVVGDGVSVFFDGRLDNRSELSRLTACGNDLEGVPDAYLVLRAYLKLGRETGQALIGDFAIVIYNARTSELMLLRDVVGLRCIYYTIRGNQILFASEAKAILAHPRISCRPNTIKLAQLLARTTAQAPLDATCFEGIQSVPPSHVVQVVGGRIRSWQFWSLPNRSAREIWSFPELAEEFAQIFRRAVSRRLRTPGRAAVTVSGGLDSSSIFCVAHDLRKVTHADAASLMGLSISYDAASSCNEAAYLVEVERCRQTQITRVQSSETGILGANRQVFWHTEVPLLSLQPQAWNQLYSTAACAGATSILTGHWGDQVLFNDEYLVELALSGRWLKTYRHFSEICKWCSDVSPRTFLARFVFASLARLAPLGALELMRKIRRRAVYGVTLAQLFSKGFTDPAGMGEGHYKDKQSIAFEEVSGLALEIRNPHALASLEWNANFGAMHGLEVAFPFLDRDLLILLAKVPGEALTWGGRPKALIREGLVGVLPEAIRGRRDKSDFTQFVDSLLASDRDWILRLLGRKRISSDFKLLNECGVDQALAHLGAGPKEASAGRIRELLPLVRLELWLRTFLDEGDGMDG